MPPEITDHFANVSAEMARRSKAISDWFKTHNPSNGANREEAVGGFLRDYLPARFHVSSGLIFSSVGEFSNQTDLAITDLQSGTPLYRDSPVPIWLVESVFAAFEVKPDLSPANIKQSVDRCRRFKTLPRRWADSFGQQRIPDSLFVLWAFDSPATETAKGNLLDTLKEVPPAEQPDFVVVPGQFLFAAGSYQLLSARGQPGSQYRQNVEISASGPGYSNLSMTVPPKMQELKEHSLLVFLDYLVSWLFAAGPRRARLVDYVDPDRVLGREI